MEMNDNNRTIIAVLAAGLAGFGLAVLLAPQKGTDLRGDMLSRLEQLGQNVNEILEEGRQRIGMGHSKSSINTKMQGSALHPNQKQAIL